MCNVSDWLAFHSLDSNSLQPLLRALDRNEEALFADHEAEDEYPTDLTAENAWTFVIEATTTVMPELQDIVKRLQARLLLDFDAPSDALPFTCNGSDEEGILISLCYRVTYEDLLCMAHELGHAVQLDASKPSQIPPVHREIAAFIFELLLLEFAKKADPRLHQGLLRAWLRENDVYLGDDLDLLGRKLSDPSSSYDYRMNYPLARMQSIQLMKSPCARSLLPWLSGQADLHPHIMTLIDCFQGSHMPNALPVVVGTDDEPPAIKNYRALGVIAAMEIETSGDHSEKPIGDRYPEFLTHLAEQTVFVALNDNQQPIGYVTWETDAHHPKIVRIKRQIAPWGDHLELRKQFERHLPDGTKVAPPREVRLDTGQSG